MTELRIARGFSGNLPTIENSIAIFDDWVSALPIPGASSGNFPAFTEDPRPSFVREVFGSLEQFAILELGSLEGGHSYQLERLGAKSITAIEANAESFIKSLIVKEALGLKTKFLHGDFLQYLQTVETRYDLIFACGVLYHMRDPLHLLELIAQRTDRVFVWTHYVSAEGDGQNYDHLDVEYAGLKCRYYKHPYEADHHQRHYSGLGTYGCYLTKNDILTALKHFGLGNIQIIRDDPQEIGSSISIVAYR